MSTITYESQIPAGTRALQCPNGDCKKRYVVEEAPLNDLNKLWCPACETVGLIKANSVPLPDDLVKRYAPVPWDLFDHRHALRLRASDGWLALAIWRHQMWAPHTKPLSIATLEKETGLARRTIFAAIDRCEKAGYLNVDRAHAHASTYDVRTLWETLERLVVASGVQKGHSTSPLRCKRDTQGVQKGHSRGAEGTREVEEVENLDSTSIEPLKRDGQEPSCAKPPDERSAELQPDVVVPEDEPHTEEEQEWMTPTTNTMSASLTDATNQPVGAAPTRASDTVDSCGSGESSSKTTKSQDSRTSSTMPQPGLDRTENTTTPRTDVFDPLTMTMKDLGPEAERMLEVMARHKAKRERKAAEAARR